MSVLVIWQNCLSVNERASEFSEMSVRQRVSYLGVTYLESLHPKTAVTGRDLAERHLPIYRFTNVTSVPRQQFSGLGVVGQPVHPSPTALLSRHNFKNRRLHLLFLNLRYEKGPKFKLNSN